MPLTSIETDESELQIEWVIYAPVVRVWETLTTPSYIGEWLGTVVSGSISSGSSFAIDHGDGYLCESTVVKSQALHALTYSWKFPDEPRTDVTWSLTHHGNSTSLTLTHSGLTDLVSSYRHGWPVHLTFFEGSALGTPLPWSVFWQIHSTIVYLDAPGRASALIDSPGGPEISNW